MTSKPALEECVRIQGVKTGRTFLTEGTECMKKPVMLQALQAVWWSRNTRQVGAAASWYLGPYFSHKTETAEPPRGRRGEERVRRSGWGGAYTSLPAPPLPRLCPTHLPLHSTHTPTPLTARGRKNRLTLRSAAPGSPGEETGPPLKETRT